MLNMQSKQLDHKKQMTQPNIIMFASPSITPSNNFKNLNVTKDMQIMGRKIDSPKLRVMKESIDKPMNQITFAQGSMQFQREDLAAMFGQIHDLNHTNKEIQKKQFDFNIKQHNKANVTIQYDENNNRQVSHSQNRQPRSKSANRSQKRRQQSQSVPRQNPQLQNYQHQPAASVVSNQAHPIINLHIQNAKIASQSKPSSIFPYNRKKTHTMGQSDQQQHLKYQTTGQQSVPLKNRSKSKNRQKSLNKSTVISQKFKDQLQMQQKPANYDNKENQSINYNEFSPSRIMQKSSNFIDSDSSLSSPNVRRVNDQFIQKQLEKQYFVDNSILLKHLSPDRHQPVTNNAHKMHPQNLQVQLLSNRDQQRGKGGRVSAENTHLLKSNNSTIAHHNINNTTIIQDTSAPKFKLKRPATGTQGYIKKQHIKGIDKIVKESLKKNRTKEEVEISRKHIEDFRLKMKKQELTQRNQQVRKINASKIITQVTNAQNYNHQHKNSQINTKMHQQQKQQILQYKKHRSKSCMNKTDSIFGGVRSRSKERLMQFQQNPNDRNAIGDQTQIENGQAKKEKKREKSLVLELKELTKQIGCEIRREIQKGKLEVHPISVQAAKQKTNLSTLNVKKEPLKPKINNYFSNVCKKKSDSDITTDHHKRGKSKNKELNKNFSQNIKKFIESKKQAKNQIKSLEQTLEAKFQLKRIENLNNLSQVRSHIRHQSQNLQYIKPNQNLNLHDNSSHNNKVSVLKKLKPQFSKEKKQSQHKQKFNYQHNNIFDEELQPRLSQSPDHSAIQYINQGDISSEQQEEYFKILNSQKKYRKEKSQSASPQRKRSTSHKKRNGSKKLSNKKEKKGLRDELDETAQSRINQRLQFEKESLDQKEQYVIQGKAATLIPPQSDITTLENKQYYFEKSSQNRQQLDQSADQTRKIYDLRKSQDSNLHSNKSPNFKEQKAKVKVFMERYGHILPSSQLCKSNAETQLMIKLQTAAITIQRNFRRHLDELGSYHRSSPNSQMYIDSEEDSNQNYQYNYNDMTSEKKDYIPQQLIASTSPLRVKTQHLNNHNYHQQQFRQPIREEVKQNKFYSADSSDVEKVIVCSVITSGRAEGEESLNNTQKYVPLRQKHQQLVSKQQPMSNISSGPNTEFNTAIKTQVPSMQQRIQEQQLQHRDNNSSIETSQRKILVPSLDFDRLNISEISKQPQKEENKQNAPKIHQDYHDDHRILTEGGLSSSRSIFDRHSFQDFAQRVHNGEGFDMNNIEFLKIKEQVIQYKAKEDEKQLKKEYKNKMVSPRTYERKRQDIELQLIKNKEEIKKQKQSLKDQYKQVAQIIQETMISHDKTKQVLKEAFNHQHSHNVVSGLVNRNNEQQMSEPNLLSSHRGQLSKREGGILEQIETYRATNQEDEDEKWKTLENDETKDQERINEQETINMLQISLQQQKTLQKQMEEENLKEEQEKQRRLEEQMKKDLEAKRLEEQRIKKLQEQEKLKKEKEAQELKQQQLREQQIKEQERLRKEEEERKKRDEQEKKAKIQQEELKRQQQLELKQKREKEEEELRQQKLKQEMEKKLKEQQEQQKALEKEQERKRQEKEEKERQQEIKRQKDLEYKNKLEAMERKFEEQKRAQVQQSQPDRYLIQPDTFSLSSEPGIVSGHKQQQHEEDDYSDQFDFDESNENKLLNDIIQSQEPNKQSRVKEVIDSIEDSNNEEPSSQPTEQEQPAKEDEPRLSRTRSSQYLKAVGQVSDDQIDMSQEESEKGFIPEKIDVIPNLNEISMEEESQQIQGISEVISSVNFFTQNFDDERHHDLMNKINNNTLDFSQAPTTDIINPLPPFDQNLNSSQNKIYVEDKGEEIKIDLQPHCFNLQEDRRHSRLSQEMRNQIPVEDEENYNPGLPVSPVSLDGIRIQTGSQSLESTLSDCAEIRTAIEEAKAEQQQPIDINVQADRLTDEIFNVMMEEMKLELDILFINGPRNGEQQQNYMLNESGRFLIFERRGIKTDLFAIEKYVEEVLDEVIKDRQRYMQSIQTPLSKNSREILNQLQNSEIGSYEHFETNYPPVLALELYLRLEKRRKESREKANLDRQESQGPVPPESNLIAECEHIHNKVLFDCINDSLLQFKPYGKDGAPLPWSRQNRRLRPMEEFTLEEMFELVKHDLFRWAIMQAGTMPRKEFVFGGVFDDELFAEIREKKLATLLAREMIETEPKWLNYEFEEAQVKIDIGDMILEQLVTETIAIMNQIQASK